MQLATKNAVEIDINLKPNQSEQGKDLQFLRNNKLFCITKL